MPELATPQDIIDAIHNLSERNLTILRQLLRTELELGGTTLTRPANPNHTIVVTPDERLKAWGRERT